MTGIYKQITGTQAVLCRTALMCDEIPMEAHDRTIDFVICEAGVLNTKITPKFS